MRTLEVGDKLYRVGNYGITDVLEITRVTPKRAFAGHKEFERTSDSWFKAFGHTAYTDMGLVSYWPETDELKSQWLFKKWLEEIKAFKFSTLRTDALLQIKTIIDNPENIKQ